MLKNKFIKKTLIITINILLCIILFQIANFVAFCMYDTLFIDKLENIPALIKDYYKRNYTPKTFSEINYIYLHYVPYRNIENPDSKLNPILLFGCSFAYGYMLNKNETFSHELGVITKRPIYNRAFSGLGPQHMLLQLQNDDFYKIIPKPEYIIYTFMIDHLNRISFPAYSYANDVYYTIGKNKKLHYKSSMLNRTPLYVDIRRRNIRWEFTKKEFDFFLLHLYESKNAAEKHWGNNIKFVVFIYDNIYNRNFEQWLYLDEELRKNGFIIVYLQDLSDKNFLTREYQISPTDSHPNAKAWEEITPLLVDKLKINNDK